MTRILIDPAQLREMGSVLRATADQIQELGVRLRDDPLPLMPPNMVVPLKEGLGEINGESGRLAATLVQEADDLDRRAQLAESFSKRHPKHIRIKSPPKQDHGSPPASSGGAPAPRLPTPLPIPTPTPTSPPSPGVGGLMAFSPLHFGWMGTQMGTGDPRGAGGAFEVDAFAYPGDGASKQQMACWMAAHAAKSGAPPELLVMCSLTETSTLQNLKGGDRDSVGFFQIRPSTNFAPPGFGVAPGTIVSGQWWVAHPEAQMAVFESKIKATLSGGRTANLRDPAALGSWCQDLERSAYPDRYQHTYDEARSLVNGCMSAGQSNGASPGTKALRLAGKEVGVREIGSPNSGPMVDVFESSTGAYSSPWCASFVTWCLKKSGHAMPAPSWQWATVGNWVDAARHHQAGLQIVSAANAHPGDLVCYDWNGGNDFRISSHIGFLKSSVVGGHFQTVEGNYSDQVANVSRTMSSAPNIVFVRVGG